MTRFFLFEDPLRMRIDLTFMSIITILLIIQIIVNIFSVNTHVINFVVFLIYVCFVQVCGGNIMLIDFFSRMIHLIRNNETEDEDGSHLQTLLKDNSFKLLFKEYSSKEMSLENYLFYEKMTEMTTKGMNSRLILKDMTKLEQGVSRPVSNMASGTIRSGR